MTEFLMLPYMYYCPPIPAKESINFMITPYIFN